MKKYPCKDCILLPSCSIYCDDMDTEEDLFYSFLEDPRCPDCGHIIFRKDSRKLGIDFICDKCGSLFKVMIYPQSKFQNSEPVFLNRINKIGYLISIKISEIKYDEATTGPYIRLIIIGFKNSILEKWRKEDE